MAAELTSSVPQPIYPYMGKNFAPVRQLEEMPSAEWHPSPLCEQLQTKYQEYKDRDYQAWKDAVDIGQMVANLREGKMLLLRNVRDGRYMFVKRDGKFSDYRTAGGLFQFYSTKLTAEWLSSRPERDPVIPSEDDRVEEYVAGVKVVQDHYDRVFFNDNYETKESLSAQDFGTWVTRYRFDPDKEDIVCELLPFPACRWDIRFRAEESSWFIFESKCSTAKLKRLLNAEVPVDSSVDNYGLQIIEQISHQGGNVAGYGKERPYGVFDTVINETIVSEMWLQPEEYADIVLNASEKTISGESLKAGDLIEMFPTGICVTGINNMQTIIGIHAEDHRDHIVSGIFHAQSFSGLGKGVSDAVDVQKEINDLHSQMLTYIKAHSTPAYAYNQNIVSEQEARKIGKPRAAIAMDFTNAPDGVNSVNQVIQTLVPGNPGNSAFSYQEILKDFLQMSFQVTTGSDAIPGVNNKTATGAQIGEANERMLLVPQHRNKADQRRRSDKVIFNLFKKYVDKPRWFRFRDLNGITKGKYLSGTQFDGVDVDFEIVADSEVPRTRFTKELAATKLLNFTSGVQGLIQAAQLDPEMTGAICQIFGVDVPTANPDKIARVCRRRVDQARKFLEEELQLQQMMMAVTGEPVDNSNLAVAIVDQLTPPIIPAEPYAPLKVAWLSNLLDDDELMYAPPEFRNVIAEMISRHVQEATLGQAITAQDQNLGMLMSNLPQLLGEQAMSERAQQMTQQFQMQQQQEQMAAQMQQQQMQAKTQRESALAQEDSDDNKTARQLQLEAAKMAMSDEQAEREHQRRLVEQQAANESQQANV